MEPAKEGIGKHAGGWAVPLELKIHPHQSDLCNCRRTPNPKWLGWGDIDRCQWSLTLMSHPHALNSHRTLLNLKRLDLHVCLGRYWSLFPVSPLWRHYQWRSSLSNWRTLSPKWLGLHRYLSRCWRSLAPVRLSIVQIDRRSLDFWARGLGALGLDVVQAAHHMGLGETGAMGWLSLGPWASLHAHSHGLVHRCKHRHNEPLYNWGWKSQCLSIYILSHRPEGPLTHH